MSEDCLKQLEVGLDLEQFSIEPIDLLMSNALRAWHDTRTQFVFSKHTGTTLRHLFYNLYIISFSHVVQKMETFLLDV